MAAPVAYGLVCGVLERHVSRAHRSHLSAQHPHALHVGVLAFDVQCSLIDHARHVHQCADRRRGHTVLSGSRLGDDAPLAHLLRQEYLADGVVYLVGTRVVEILALEI